MAACGCSKVSHDTEEKDHCTGWIERDRWVQCRDGGRSRKLAWLRMVTVPPCMDGRRPAGSPIPSRRPWVLALAASPAAPCSAVPVPVVAIDPRAATFLAAPAGYLLLLTQSRPGHLTARAAAGRTLHEFIFTCPCRLPPARPCPRLFLSRCEKIDEDLDPVDAARRRAVLVLAPAATAHGMRAPLGACRRVEAVLILPQR